MDRFKEKLEDFLDELQAKSFRKGKSWKGYDVYVPEYDEMVYIGLPLVLLVKSEEMRISTGEECLDYWAFEDEEEAQ